MHTKKKIVVCVKSMHCLINFAFFGIYLCDNVIFWEKNINGQDNLLNHSWYFKEIIYVHLPYNKTLCAWYTTVRSMNSTERLHVWHWSNLYQIRSD
jgi:hypothetical protein